MLEALTVATPGAKSDGASGSFACEASEILDSPDFLT